MNSITFILPTRNRPEYVGRAVDSCLAAESKELSVRVLVIDGSTIPKSIEILRERFKQQPAVEVLKQPVNVEGFMEACFFGVARLETPFATFMYDDDILSPHISEMYQHMMAKNKLFAMGFGQINNVDQIFPFQRVINWYDSGWWPLLLGWFGNTIGNYGDMPVSPVCCLTTSDLLRSWIFQVQQFTKQNSFRRYYIMQRNIGADLMIYIQSIIEAKDKILLADGVVAQWSEHPDSMTVVADDLDLFAGYWLAKCWAVGYCYEFGMPNRAARMAGYVVLSGVSAAIRAKRNGNAYLVKNFLTEIYCLINKIGLIKIICQTVMVAISIAFFRLKRFTRYGSQRRSI